ncbi:MAG: hypothetical protein RLZZ597_473 [Cyanobacteriota bacterium]
MVRKTAKRFLALTLAAYSLALVVNVGYGLRTPIRAADFPVAPVVAKRKPMESSDSPQMAPGLSASTPTPAVMRSDAVITWPLDPIGAPAVGNSAEMGSRPTQEVVTEISLEPTASPVPEPTPAQGPTTVQAPLTTQNSTMVQEVSTPGSAQDSEAPQEPAPEPSQSESAPSDSPAAMAELFIGLSPEQVKRSELLMEADRYLVAGDRAAADALYRQAKEAKWLAEMTSGEAIVPITDAEALPPAGRVYWREAQAGLESGFPNRVLVPLELLVKDYPDFLPAQSLYARYLIQQERTEEARQLLEALALRFPYHPDILRAQVQLQMAQERWIEAAITANQFALLNPENPDAAAMEQLAEENLSRFRGEVNASLTRNLVGNIITGAASYFLTGGLFGPFTALNSGILLMQGESALGQQVADQVKRQLPIVTDPEVRDYVNEVGQRLAALAGRDEFNYTFEVVMDDSLNAFALPGGKIFINAGAITNSYSEAELAGLLGHEISHAVLSHGFQMVTQGNLTASLAAFIPIPEVANIAANLIVASYSRDMERQSDILGTKLLSTGNYAADGLHNLMSTLEAEYGNRSITWFASHPNPGERVSYLKQLIDQGGFDRYTYEGVEKHLTVRKKTIQLINQYRLENSRPDKRPQRY